MRTPICFSRLVTPFRYSKFKAIKHTLLQEIMRNLGVDWQKISRK